MLLKPHRVCESKYTTRQEMQAKHDIAAPVAYKPISNGVVTFMECCPHASLTSSQSIAETYAVVKQCKCHMESEGESVDRRINCEPGGERHARSTGANAILANKRIQYPQDVKNMCRSVVIQKYATRKEAAYDHTIVKPGTFLSERV